MYVSGCYPPDKEPITIGGTVVGLAPGTKIVLGLNTDDKKWHNTESLTVTENGSFQLSTPSFPFWYDDPLIPLWSGWQDPFYQVVVKSHADGKICT